MYCKKCGAQLDNEASFCPSCGQAVSYDVSTQQSTGAGQERKSKLVAGLLGILLGSFGVHNFYLGFTNKALAQLLITLLTCGIGSVVTSVWGLIEGILILMGKEKYRVDAKGIPLED